MEHITYKEILKFRFGDNPKYKINNCDILVGLSCFGCPFKIINKDKVYNTYACEESQYNRLTKEQVESITNKYIEFRLIGNK